VGASILPPPGQRCIVVDDLRLAVFIGVHEHEKAARQEVSISIHMFVPDAGPSRSDDLTDHVSYSDVVSKLKERAKATRHVHLVETLAEEAADFALADARVESVVVEVRKTEIVPEAKGVGVIINRRRKPADGSG
jgi:7,8-dihydroneopterin aldolase/epimerase/oxygenase